MHFGGSVVRDYSTEGQPRLPAIVLPQASSLTLYRYYRCYRYYCYYTVTTVTIP